MMTVINSKYDLIMNVMWVRLWRFGDIVWPSERRVGAPEAIAPGFRVRTWLAMGVCAERLPRGGGMDEAPAS